MTSNYFFIEKTRTSGRPMILAGPEHHHLSRVIRSKPGDIVWLFDEEGNMYRTRIEEIGTDMTKLALLETAGRTEFRVRIVLGQSLLKAKAMDFVVQKSTEIGLFAIIPVLTARSVVKVEGRSEKKVGRWMKIAREASKQSKSGVVPRIYPPEPLDAFLRDREAGQKIFLSEHDGCYLRDIVLRRAKRPPADVIMLIGPEGGWTRDEEKTIAGRGYEAVSLGTTILRAETAALYAAAILSHFWNL